MPEMSFFIFFSNKRIYFQINEYYTARTNRGLNKAEFTVTIYPTRKCKSILVLHKQSGMFPKIGLQVFVPESFQ